MDLTSEDQRVWMAEQGLEMPDVGGFVRAGDATDEDRAALREKFQNMTAEEREQARAEMGIERPKGAGGGLLSDGMGNRGAAGLRGGIAVVQALIDLLTERAAE